MNLSLTDFAFYAMSTDKRDLDFSLVAKLKRRWTQDELEKGQKPLLKVFPSQTAPFKKYQWKAIAAPWRVEVVHAKSEEDRQRWVETYLTVPFDLTKERGVKELLIYEENETYLVIRFHHALGDGLSLLLWLKAQFENKEQTNTPLKLKTFEKPKKVSAYAYHSPPLLMALDPKGEVSHFRKWLSFTLDPSELKLSQKPYTYNDLLCAMSFKSMRQWKKKRASDHTRHGLYLPINIRENPFEGFGNGSSRIKIYDDEKISLITDLSRYIREQVSWCRKNGIWSMPQRLGLFKYLPVFISRLILKMAANLPSVDMGSMVFSHVESYKGYESVFKEFESLFTICQLYQKYSIGLAATTFQNQTLLTLTYDSNQITTQDAEDFMFEFKKVWDQTKGELSA